ncbi:MAG: 5'-Nucleotidase domain protein [Parcubacteria group bacterium GW2011_GWB1_42_6]|nr:MAG: 5'-Nucleotidase domain protein [Parcubacteria group bacterium GW2011_GWB1_42_6]
MKKILCVLACVIALSGLTGVNNAFSLEPWIAIENFPDYEWSDSFFTDAWGKDFANLYRGKECFLCPFYLYLRGDLPKGETFLLTSIFIRHNNTVGYNYGGMESRENFSKWITNLKIFPWAHNDWAPIAINRIEYRDGDYLGDEFILKDPIEIDIANWWTMLAVTGDVTFFAPVNYLCNFSCTGGKVISKTTGKEKQITRENSVRNNSPVPILTVVDPIQTSISVNSPTEFKMANHPNPFNPSTTISFSLPKAGETTVEVFNVSGQKVATLASGFRQAGRHSIIWNAKSFSAGMYFCTIRQGNEAKKLKMTLMK